MEPKRLYKSRTNRTISGVCGGIAEYCNIDPTIVRLIAVILLFTSLFFPAIIGYFVASAVIPEAPQ